MTPPRLYHPLSIPRCMDDSSNSRELEGEEGNDGDAYQGNHDAEEEDEWLDRLRADAGGEEGAVVVEKGPVGVW
jgi:hypothetical protein